MNDSDATPTPQGTYAPTPPHPAIVEPFAGVADEWARLVARLPRVPVIDGLIAATALRHRLTVVTRNEADFASTGVPLLNPWNG